MLPFIILNLILTFYNPSNLIPQNYKYLFDIIDNVESCSEKCDKMFNCTGYLIKENTCNGIFNDTIVKQSNTYTYYKKEYCNQKCNSRDFTMDTFGERCFCDSHCEIQNDCCYDYETNCKTSTDTTTTDTTRTDTSTTDTTRTDTSTTNTTRTDTSTTDTTRTDTSTTNTTRTDTSTTDTTRTDTSTTNTTRTDTTRTDTSTVSTDTSTTILKIIDPVNPKNYDTVSYPKKLDKVIIIICIISLLLMICLIYYGCCYDYQSTTSSKIVPEEYNKNDNNVDNCDIDSVLSSVDNNSHQTVYSHHISTNEYANKQCNNNYNHLYNIMNQNSNEVYDNNRIVTNTTYTNAESTE